MTKILRQRVLFEDCSLRVLSSYYRPGTVFAPHCDTRSRITLTLQGAVIEEVSHRSEAITAGDILLKSFRIKHENRYAPEGAQHVSIELLSELDEGVHRHVNDIDWTVQQGIDAVQHSATVIDAALAADGAGLHTVLSDICASVRKEPGRSSTPPVWLQVLKSDLEEVGLAGVDVARYAIDVGVHPVHVSRLFHSCYGISITIFAQSHAVRRALQVLLSNQNLASVASAAGFYDQSHMCRVFRRITGRTPGEYRSLWMKAVC